MAEKLKKIDKEYQLTDDSVNCYGFRLLTSGYDLPEYQRSPIGYYMHERPLGIILRWEDFRTEGDKVFAKPVINMANPRGQQTVDEIENGFLNAASIGHIVALEFSEDPEMMLPGQTGPTVTKWYNRECSLVDIPGNPNSFSLYDADDNKINLADLTKTSTPKTMSKVLVLTAITLAALKLPAEATPEQADKAIADLAADNTRLIGEQTTLNAAKKKAEDDLADLKATTVAKEVEDLLSTAVTDKKISVETQTQLAADYAGNPTGLRKLLGALKAYVAVTDLIGKSSTTDLPEKFKGKTYDDLFASGDLADLKENHVDAYTEVYKAKFGKEPKA